MHRKTSEQIRFTTRRLTKLGVESAILGAIAAVLLFSSNASDLSQKLVLLVAFLGLCTVLVANLGVMKALFVMIPMSVLAYLTTIHTIAITDSEFYQIMLYVTIAIVIPRSISELMLVR